MNQFSKAILRYSMSFDESELTITAFINGNKVAHLNVVNDDPKIWVSSVLVYEGFRRQGIATDMYLYAQSLLNKPFRPSEEQTEDAKYLWDYLESVLKIE